MTFNWAGADIGEALASAKRRWPRKSPESAASSEIQKMTTMKRGSQREQERRGSPGGTQFQAIGNGFLFLLLCIDLGEERGRPPVIFQ
eukprot:scaffold20219_cov131-Skeletonema_marinoi.AAC.1